MTVTEFWWLAESKRPSNEFGNMSRDEVRQIYEETYGRDDD